MTEIEHIYSPEQYAKAVELWERLIDHPHTHLTIDGAYFSAIERAEPEHLHALVLTDGSATDDYEAVTLILISYSDYGGSDLDAANVRALDGTPGVNVTTDGIHGDGKAWIQLGELPTNNDDGTDDGAINTGIEWLEHLANIMDRLIDYGLISDDTHSEYVDELASEAWEQWLDRDVRHDLASLAAHNDVPIPQGLTHDGYSVGYPDEYVDYLWDSHEEQIREAYYAYEHNEWNAETATSVTNGCHEDAVLHVARTVFQWDI